MPCSHLWLKPRMCNHCPCIVTNILENIAVTPFLTGRCLLSQWKAQSRGQSNCFKMCITHHCTVWLITQVPKPNNSMLYVQKARPHMLFFPFSFSELLLQSDFTIFYHLKAALVAMKQSLKPSLGGRQANLQTPPPSPRILELHSMNPVGKRRTVRENWDGTTAQQHCKLRGRERGRRYGEKGKSDQMKGSCGTRCFVKYLLGA